jgi:hypothetical protein
LALDIRLSGLVVGSSSLWSGVSEDSAEFAFRLRQQFSAAESDPEPVSEWASYGVWRLVGNGGVPHEMCGKYRTLKGCLGGENGEAHNHVGLDGVNYKGKVYVKVVHHWCNRPSCKICFKHGWAVREAHKAERRLAEAAKRFGQAEHIVASVPKSDYGLPFRKMRLRCVAALYARGVVGGVLIFHAFRYNDYEEARRKHMPLGWYYSPHFHILGFILGGFRECRRCEHVDEKGSRSCCGGCEGFYGRSKKCYDKDSYIVEVEGERETIGGTLWYQLNHASVDSSMKRFHVSTWFGVCSYRKLKVTVEKRKELCPICGEELEKLMCLGSLRIVKERGAAGYQAAFLDDLVTADGSLNYQVVRGGSSGRYE